jgi:hypothetical protein
LNSRARKQIRGSSFSLSGYRFRTIKVRAKDLKALLT